MATTISVIGLLLAAIIFVVAIWKGLDVFTSTILVSFIIILTSWMDWWTSLSSYAEGYVGFIQNNVFVLVIGAVFGELMAASGCAESIANVVTEKMGAKRVILSIALITTVFVYVGVSGFVVLFVLAPIATIMMKQAGYPYRMIPGIIFIGATCSAMIPYAINITNIMPAQYLGTSMGSAPILGWVAFVVSFAVGYFYMVHAAKKAAIKEGTAIDESQPVKIQPTRDDFFGGEPAPVVLLRYRFHFYNFLIYASSAFFRSTPYLTFTKSPSATPTAVRTMFITITWDGCIFAAAVRIV
jgi:H+/gluconate symporter-like permease